jgi:hypothetical protein
MRSFIICTLHPPNSIRVTKSKRRRKGGHVTSTGEMRNAYKINCSQSMIILKQILREAGFVNVDWIHLTHAETNGRILQAM